MNGTVSKIDEAVDMIDRKSCYLIKVLCIGLISAVLLTGCGGPANNTLEGYFTDNQSARDSVISEINGQFESTGAKSNVEVEGNDITVIIDITDLAHDQGIEKTNKNVKIFKEEFEESFSNQESLFKNSLSGLASKVHSGSITMKVKIVWDDDIIFSDSFKGDPAAKK